MRIMLLMLIFSAALFSACSNSEGTLLIAEDSSILQHASIKNSILIKDKNGINLGHINIANHRETRLSWKGEEWIGTLKEEKRIYTQKGKIIGTVKYKDDTPALKMKDKQGNLLWKLRFKADKIKIQKTEEGEQGLYVLKIEPDKIVVLKGENTPIGAVRLEEENLYVEGKEDIKIQYNKLSPAFGVLLMDDFTIAEKATIIAELLIKGY